MNGPQLLHPARFLLLLLLLLLLIIIIIIIIIYNALIKSSLLYGSETWKLTENNKRRVEATEMDALKRSSRISRKERIKNVTIRQQIRLEETVIKEIEQNQLTWYGHVQRMVEGRLPKIAFKWMPKQRRARRRPKKNWMEGIRP